MALSDNTPGNTVRFIDAPNRLIKVGNTQFAYRELGPQTGVPLFLFNYWGGVLDNFDPRVVDALATTRRVIATDYRGMGGSGGAAPLTVGEMALDMIALIRAMGFDKVDVLGFSLGGFVAQDIVLKAPGLVRKLILTGAGPAGGYGIEKIGAVSWPLILKGLLTLRDPKFHMFFTSTRNGRQAAKSYLMRLKERKKDRDKDMTPKAFLRQFKAIKAWGQQAPQDLDAIQIPVLIAGGENDIMVPIVNGNELARRIKGSEFIVYPDSGHGAVFQYHAEFTRKAQSFLAA